MLVSWRSIAGIFCIALFVRGIVGCMALWNVGPLGQLNDDPDAYRIIAETLAASGIFGIAGADGTVDPTAFRPPLYPWLLSWLVVDSAAAQQDLTAGGRVVDLSLPAVAALHCLLGAITAAATAVAVQSWLRELISSIGGRGPEVLNSLTIKRAGLLAGLLVTFDPLLVMQSTLIMTETLATGLAAAAWMLIGLACDWQRISEARSQCGPDHRDADFRVPDLQSSGHSIRSGWRWQVCCEWSCWLGASLMLALGFLCRPTFIVWTMGIGLLVALRFAWALWRTRKWVWREFAVGCLIAITTGAAVVGWMLRNDSVIGKPVWATTHGGYTLLLGNNPHFYDFLRERSFGAAGFWGDAWDAESFHRDWERRLDSLRADLLNANATGSGLSKSNRLTDQNGHVDQEVWEDQLAAEWAKQTIREQPSMFVYSGLVRVARLWSPIPRVGQAISVVSILLGVYYLLIYAGCLLAIWRFRFGLLGWRRGTLGRGCVGFSALVLVCSLTLVHAVYWSNVRMRAPAMPVLLGLAAIALASASVHPLGRVKH